MHSFVRKSDILINFFLISSKNYELIIGHYYIQIWIHFQFWNSNWAGTNITCPKAKHSTVHVCVYQLLPLNHSFWTRRELHMYTIYSFICELIFVRNCNLSTSIYFKHNHEYSRRLSCVFVILAIESQKIELNFISFRRTLVCFDC